MAAAPSTDLTGKIALVTGASRGVGRDIALRLAGAGADVVVTYHTRAELAEDVGSVAAFLCSDAGRWVTGQHLEISGGMFL